MPSNWEVELKFEVQDEQALLRNLAGIGFGPEGTEQHRDVYFRHPCRDFRATDEAFRLRQLDSAAFVTYKGPRQAAKVKTRAEIELTLNAEEFSAWREMLAKLGFTELPPVEKLRHVYKPSAADRAHEGFTVTLDKVQQLGTFAEIELIVEAEPALGAAQARVENLGRELGLDLEQPQSYLSQLLAKLGIE